MSDETIAEHAPDSPGKRCVACGSLWPCDVRELQDTHAEALAVKDAQIAALEAVICERHRKDVGEMPPGECWRCNDLESAEEVRVLDAFCFRMKAQIAALRAELAARDMEWCNCNCHTIGCTTPEHQHAGDERCLPEHDPANRHAACREVLVHEEEILEDALVSETRAAAFEEAAQVAEDHVIDWRVATPATVPGAIAAELRARGRKPWRVNSWPIGCLT